MAEFPMTLDDLSVLRQDPFSQAIEELRKLLSQPNRAFLLGAGCSKCAGLPLMSELTEDVVRDVGPTGPTGKVLAFLQTEYDGGHGSTVEDYLSDLVDVVAVAARRKHCGVDDPRVDIGGEKYGVSDLEAVADDIKAVMVGLLEPANFDIGTHRQFVSTVQSLRTGKSNTGAPVDYFVLNYDTLVEDALGLERLRYLDGFSGGAVGWWDGKSFRERTCDARVFKLHGSLDWRLLRDDILPRRIRNKDLLTSLSDEVRERVIIWPAATKYREAQRDPFAQMLRHFRESLNRPGREEVILTICGYRFADAHINAEIEQALRDSQKRLNLLVFTGEEETPRFVSRWLESDFADQVRVHARRGFFHKDKAAQSTVDLPWWKFENLIRLLRGER